MLRDFFSRPAVDIMEFHDQPITVFVNVFVYHISHPAVGIFRHRLRVALPLAPPLRLRRTLRRTTTRAIENITILTDVIRIPAAIRG